MIEIKKAGEHIVPCFFTN